MENRFSLSEVPAPVDYETEGYDGPAPNVTALRPPLFREPITEVTPAPRVNQQYVATINAALDVVSARLPALISTIAACLLWSFAVYDPQMIRTYAALGFSLTVLAPTIVLYLKRG